MSCPFYKNECLLKHQANLPDFKNEHDCKAVLQNCSFFIKEKLKQIKVDTKLKIIIKRFDNPYLVKADVLIYPTNNLLRIDDHILKKMTLNQSEKVFQKHKGKDVQMGYPYVIKVPEDWKIKQKNFINAVVAGESRLVNEADVSSAIKKSLIMSDEMGFESALMLPCDNGTHDISLTSLAQLSAVFFVLQKYEFKYLKNIFICMSDEESEQTFIEYYNRIFGERNESRNRSDNAVDTERTGQTSVHKEERQINSQ